MRMAYVCADPGVPVFGTKGCSVHVQEVARAFRRRGVTVVLFTTRTGGPPPADLSDVTVVELPRVDKGPAALRERASIEANADTRRLLAGHGPFDLVYERYSLWSSAGMEFAAGAGAPGVLEVNAPLLEEQATYRELADPAAARQMTRNCFAAAGTIGAVSKQVCDYVETFPEASGKVHLVANGVDARRFRPGVPPAFPRDNTSFVVGFVGSLKAWHGVPVLLEAFADIARETPAARLLIVGEGPERPRIGERANELGIACNLHFTGAVSPEKVPAYLASMDVAAAPYPDLSGFYFSPLKVYEYMAAGLPVVASRAGDIPDLIEDGANGLLHRGGDARDLTRALRRLRDDPELRRRLGAMARERVLRHHTWDAVVGRIQSLTRSAKPRTMVDAEARS